MPHINRIRVNNVKYNFGTQFYDDFLMRFSCKNTIYDLANGGGKSVLMLLLLQNLIPNCTLDDKQPIEKLFRTNNGSTTIHSMIEWSLSDIHVKDNFKYMLTGFCARKAKDVDTEQMDSDNETTGVKNGASIEYFNYCIFYRNFNDNDIKNFPLTKNGERITYTGLKTYLKELEKKDYSLAVKIFEKKGDYQRFIADYGLYESEWEIIRGINKTEGHVRTYFETNYKTTRKVVEDLLIEEIIEKSFRNKYSDEDHEDGMAETLLDIKDQLLELSKKKDEIHNFDRQIEVLDEFAKRVNSIRQLYLGIDQTFLKLQKCYNTILDLEKSKKNELEEIADQKLKLMKEKNDLSRKLETAKVIVDMKQLDILASQLKSLEEEFQTLNEENKSILEQIRLAEAGNYYLDYLDNKNEYEQLQLVIENVMKDSGTILSQLQQYVAIKKIQDDQVKDELNETIKKEREIAEHESASLKNLTDYNRQMDNDIAVLRYQEDLCTRQLAELDNKIANEKKKTSLLLATDAVESLKKISKSIEELNEKCIQTKEKASMLSQEKVQIMLKQQQLENEKNTLEETLAQYEEKSKKLLNASEKLEKLREVYREKDVRTLFLKIEETYQKMLITSHDNALLVERKENELASLNKGRRFIEEQKFSEILDYIKRYHSDHVVTGSEYLAELDSETRVRIVRKNPLIPYSIIVLSGYEQIVYDQKLQEVNNMGYVIPIINGEQIKKPEDLINLYELSNPDDISFAAELAESFSDEKMTIYTQKLKNELEALKSKCERRAENIQVIHEDYLFLQDINNNYVDEKDLELGKTIDELTETIQHKEIELNSVKEHFEGICTELDTVNKNIMQINTDMNERHLEKEACEQIVEMLKEYQALDQKHQQTTKQLSALEKEYSDSVKHFDAANNMANQRTKKINSIHAQLENMESDWETKYQRYFNREMYEKLQNSEDPLLESTSDEVTTQLNALIESVAKENSAIEDKEKLLSAYQQNMKKSLQRIQYVGIDVDVLSNQYANHELQQNGPEELRILKDQRNNVETKKQALQEQIEKNRSTRDKLQGKVTHAISIISEKYGYFQPDSIKNEDVQTFLNDNGEILDQLDTKLQSQVEKLKNLEQDTISIAISKKNIEKIMEKAQIKANLSAGRLESENEITQECDNISKDFDHFIEDKYKKSDEFTRELTILIDTLKKMNATDLAYEIRSNIIMPTNLSETDDLIKTFQETNQYIALEKERIEKGLLNMQVIKDNFENQCIQSCINIKTELDRLPKLSKITMDGESIAVLNLKIPYVKEDTYKERMSDYIDRIAKGTDLYDKTEDKLKYIRNNLCWKKMFSVIVTDMNAIRLNLYKRERIAKQSRYLPYEEAVGSTGQSQGIYIQFLVAIINYITSIHSKNADASRLKKVIFIDNPFGAAKDIYIWEPIFKLLSTNNVQLIVPARGATPAITGRFDVNYVLGQKICDGTQQTVVVNYFSNVDKEELEYTTLSYEQTALF